jgi:transcriptional regulator with XRE-family HTH domain
VSGRRQGTMEAGKLNRNSKGKSGKIQTRLPGVESHPRKIRVTTADIFNSPRLERLARRLTALHEASELTKPHFALSLGISGSQFRSLRARKTNPTIRALGAIAESSNLSLFELLEDTSLGRRKNLPGKQMTDNFGRVVARFIQDRNLTTRAFADSIEVARPHVYRILRGDSNPTLLVAEHIARCMELTLWQLLGVEPMPQPKKTSVARIPRTRHSESARLR